MIMAFYVRQVNVQGVLFGMSIMGRGSDLH